MTSVRSISVAVATIALAACGSSTSPKTTRPVAVRLGVASTAVGAQQAGIDITGVRLVVGRASIGNGDQFGCADCQGNGGDSNGPNTQQIVDVPLNGGTVLVATEDVAAGTYASAEVSVESPTAATAGHTSGWPAGATIDIVGRIRGTPFELPLTAAGSFRGGLTPPLVVATVGKPPSPVSVTIALPVASWFLSGSTPLDPTNAAQRAQIEANVRAAFQSSEPQRAGGES
jgi:hypothetical protein